MTVRRVCEKASARSRRPRDRGSPRWPSSRSTRTGTRVPEAYFLTPAERTEWKNVTDGRRGREVHRGVLRQARRRRLQAGDLPPHRRRRPAVQDAAVQARGRFGPGPPADRARNAVPRLAVAGAGGAGRGHRHDPEHRYAIEQRRGFRRSSMRGRTCRTSSRRPSAYGSSRREITVDPAQGRDVLDNTTESREGDGDDRREVDRQPERDRGRDAAPTAGAAPAAPARRRRRGSAPAAAAVAPPRAARSFPCRRPSRRRSRAWRARTRVTPASGPGRSTPSTGNDFLALQFYLPTNKPEFSASAPLQFGGLVTDESGKEVDSFWEEASFAEVTEGSRKDRVFDRAVTLQPGSYKGTFGLFPAEGQPPVASGVGQLQDPGEPDGVRRYRR